MEIIIAAAFCIWMTVFAVWACIRVKKDYKDVDSSDSASREKKEDKG